MLDRESKREKILEGKLREIKIKLKKQQEQADARAAMELLRQAEKTADDLKAPEETPKLKPSTSQGEQQHSVAVIRVQLKLSFSSHWRGREWI